MRTASYRQRSSTRHLHAHRQGDAAHAHVVVGRNSRILGWALAFTLGFAVIELVAGLWSNSLALLSDAGHMATDATALVLALVAQLIAKRPPSARHSFGFGRAEALAAFLNSLAMLGIVVWISFHAIQRLLHPASVEGGTVFIVAAIGLVINLVVARLLAQDTDNVNTRAALVNVLGDLLGSVAALVAGAVIHFTGWMYIDPILSLFVSLLILRSTFGVLRESYHLLMEGVPHGIDYLQVGNDLEKIAGVLSVHDLHVWEMTPGQPALIGHVEIRDLQEWPAVLRAIKAMLLRNYAIDHVTLQAELPGMVDGE